ncbi:MAG: HD domain-containing protein [Patescibacteria group bacterium]|jgi:putative nucleotidyltransferase with HDIG domain
MKKDSLPPLKKIKKWMFEIAAANKISNQVEDTWRHSKIVWDFAYQIAKYAKANGYTVDLELLKTGCYVHDIGRMKTGSKASKELKHPIFHLYEGYHEMKKRRYPELARICICHAGGSGLDKETNKKYKFIAKDFFPLTIEEKIIAYSDCRTDFKKGVGPVIGPFSKAYKRFSIYSGADERMNNIHNFIKKITANKIS